MTTITEDFPGGRTHGETHAPAAAGENPHPELTDDLLVLLADTVDDLEKVRIANENRFRQLTRTESDADGHVRGHGLAEDDAEVKWLADIVKVMGESEHQAVLALQRRLRKHPLGPWIKATVGIGEKQGARLLAAIGDPYWNDLHGRPRTVSELWAFCGYRVITTSAADHGPGVTPTGSVGGGAQQGDLGHPIGVDHTKTAGVAQSKQRGVKVNWSPTARMRAYLVAESCMKQRSSPYRAVYDEGRIKYAEAVHQVACRRCGPSGKPAQPGSPLSDGHKHGRALRLVTKAILKDLWREARKVHGIVDEE